MNKTLLLVGTCLLAAFARGGASPAGEATLVLRNGRVVTVDPAKPEGQAIAMRGPRILAVGTNEEIATLIADGTEVIHLNGRLAIPGFIESHGHYLGLGDSKTILNLTDAKRWDDIVSMVGSAARAAAPDAWIRGRGWHQEMWDAPPPDAVEGNPVHAGLSAVSPRHPVFLGHRSGHAALVNRRGLELAGIDRNTADPPGGTIVKGPDGEPTGLLRETAQRLVSAAMTRARAGRSQAEIEAEVRRQSDLAAEEALRNGVTSFHDAGSSFATIDILRTLETERALPVRLYVMVRHETNETMDRRLPQYFMPIQGDDYLTVRSIKRQIDGALGSHGAWLLEPYADDPAKHGTGLTLEDPGEIERTAEVAITHGFQVNTHAIGDRANREVLDIYERVFRAHPDKRDLRWRIEHAQHLHPADVPRFHRLGVIAAMQGVHATSDGPWIPTRLGERRALQTSYVWRDLIAAGTVVTNGTDVPVESIDPIRSLYSAVARKTATGAVFGPTQKMTREEALRAYTVNGAFAVFEEQEKGSLAPGRLADVVVLSKDIMTVPEDEIPTARVDCTIVGGRVAYRRQ